MLRTETQPYKRKVGRSVPESEVMKTGDKSTEDGGDSGHEVRKDFWIIVCMSCIITYTYFKCCIKMNSCMVEIG